MAPGQLSQEQLARGEVGESARALGVDQLGAEQPALDDELWVHAAEVAENLRDSSDVVADKGDSRRPFKVGIEDSPVGACCGTFHQGVLEHLVIGAGGAQLAAQGGEVADFEAAVLGEDGRVGVREMLAYLFDDCDLLRSRTCHERSFDHIFRPGACDYGSAGTAARTT